MEKGESYHHTGTQKGTFSLSLDAKSDGKMSPSSGSVAQRLKELGTDPLNLKIEINQTPPQLENYDFLIDDNISISSGSNAASVRGEKNDEFRKDWRASETEMNQNKTQVESESYNRLNNDNVCNENSRPTVRGENTDESNRMNRNQQIQMGKNHDFHDDDHNSSSDSDSNDTVIEDEEDLDEVIKDLAGSGDSDRCPNDSVSVRLRGHRSQETAGKIITNNTVRTSNLDDDDRFVCVKLECEEDIPLQQSSSHRRLPGNTHNVFCSTPGSNGSIRGDPLTYDDSPTRKLMKQLQAELLDALVQKEEAFSEIQTLREKLAASEKKVKDLTKTVNDLNKSQEPRTRPKSKALPVTKQSPRGRPRNDAGTSSSRSSRIVKEAEKAQLKLKKETEPNGSRRRSTKKELVICIPRIKVDIIKDDDDQPAPIEKKENEHSPSIKVERNNRVHQDDIVDDDHDDDDCVDFFDADRDNGDEDHKPSSVKASKRKRKGDNIIKSKLAKLKHEVEKEDSSKPKRAKAIPLPKDENGHTIRPVCHVCSLTLQNYAKLKVHMLIHTGERPFKCNQCDKAYSRKAQLEGHMRYHNGERPYVCNICGKAYALNSCLYVHKKSHSGRQYQCSVCAKTFAQSCHLAQHMRTHTGQTPFKCKLCPKEFKQKSNLVHHERLHTGLKPFQCPTCGKLFSNSSAMLRHMRKHANKKAFQCPLCPKSFNEGNYLNRHMTIHTGERPHACEVCGRAFRLKYNLYQHMKIHDRSSRNRNRNSNSSNNNNNNNDNNNINNNNNNNNNMKEAPVQHVNSDSVMASLDAHYWMASFSTRVDSSHLKYELEHS